jgi:cytochrome c556
MKFAASLILIAVSAAMLSACGEPKDTHPGQPVAKRKAIFKDMLRVFEPMGMVGRDRGEYDKENFLTHARELQRLAKQPWVYFDPDTNYPPTKAKPDVWQRPEEFAQQRQKFQELTDQLLKAAQVGNLDVIRPLANDVEKSCQSCHKQFRNKV